MQKAVPEELDSKEEAQQNGWSVHTGDSDKYFGDVQYWAKEGVETKYYLQPDDADIMLWDAENAVATDNEFTDFYPLPRKSPELPIKPYASWEWRKYYNEWYSKTTNKPFTKKKTSEAAEKPKKDTTNNWKDTPEYQYVLMPTQKE